LEDQTLLLSPERQRLTNALTAAVRHFVVAHEAVHVLNDHNKVLTQSADFGLIPGQQPGEALRREQTISTFTRPEKLELEADALGQKFALPLRGRTENRAVLRTLKAPVPKSFFCCRTHWRTYAEGSDVRVR
jgi:hypothetical protein